MIKYLDPNIGKAACDFQNPLLAYVLRVDPESAGRRVQRALVARGKQFNACNERLLTDVASMHYDPVLEPIALRALWDPDPQIVSDAAEMLRQFGSPKAEEPLWERHKAWSRRSAKHKAELNMALVRDEGDRHAAQAYLGRALFQAIACGQGWLLDGSKLQRLGQLSDIPVSQDEVGTYLEAWKEKALILTIYSCSPRFDAHLVQYQFTSANDLENKLKQFPKGSSICITMLPDETDRQCLDRVRQSAIDDGLSVTVSTQRH